ncbi:hypothetical protein TYRP_002028 [Tyrophagus putrescentiae]|nr:hypothetical protein TYRP_002028 [Tyrophagus putrescentiae]
MELFSNHVLAFHEFSPVLTSTRCTPASLRRFASSIDSDKFQPSPLGMLSSAEMRTKRGNPVGSASFTDFTISRARRIRFSKLPPY